MKRFKFFVFILILGTGLSLYGADSPFAGDSVNLENEANPTSPASTLKNVETGEAIKFPVVGLIEAGSDLRLRGWPWGAVLGLYGSGTSVEVTGISGEFYQVVVDGKKGYMHKNYIAIPGVPASGEEPYYPGDTRSGGHLSVTDGTAVSNGEKKVTAGSTNSGNSGNSGSLNVPASDAEKNLANYKGGKLSPEEFGNLFGPVARENMKKTGVPASVTLAQAALETGWGGSSIGDAKNLFGIKGTGPAGTINVPTKEFVNGQMITVQDNFRKYNSWQESIEDHGKLLQNSRYSYALQYKNDPDRYAQEIHKAGYATDPNYASKLISIMKSNNFYQYDV
jgi:flagellum-specific peptidoglycan hydrolase FlgJ